MNDSEDLFHEQFLIFLVLISFMNNVPTKVQGNLEILPPSNQALKMALKIDAIDLAV
jgi:hypothetical protein